MLKDAVACFECEIATQIRSGDHTIYIGEVHYSWENPEENYSTFRKELKQNHFKEGRKSLSRKRGKKV